MFKPSPVLTYYSHGKLLITGEYLVLDGALALALPTRQGQSLRVETDANMGGVLVWESYTSTGERWFYGRFDTTEGKYLDGDDPAVGQRLEQLIKSGIALRSDLGMESLGFRVRTDLEFPRNWGLGTSSTLVANLAQWWQVDPHELLAKTFGGSGYDLACADADSAIFYRLLEGKPSVQTAAFEPPFADQLYFLYLGQKQNSRSGIALYREKGGADQVLLDQISSISRQCAETQSFSEFCKLLEEHERIVGTLIEMEPVKNRLFPDFSGTIKSLGAWGGDFVLVTTELPITELVYYFRNKGFLTLVPYREMVFLGGTGQIEDHFPN